jgi:hypothetical protein
MQIPSKMDDGFSKRKQKPCKGCRFYAWTMLRTRKNSGTVIMSWPCFCHRSHGCILRLGKQICWETCLQTKQTHAILLSKQFQMRITLSPAATRLWPICRDIKSKEGSWNRFNSHKLKLRLCLLPTSRRQDRMVAWIAGASHPGPTQAHAFKAVVLQ